MKAVNPPMRRRIEIITILLVFVSIFSCSSDTDEAPPAEPDVVEDPDTTPPVENKVRTLLNSFRANDGLSVDANGMVYASDFNNFMGVQVLRVDPESAAVEVAVDNVQAPTGNVTDDSGNTFVVHNVRQPDPNSSDTEGDVIRIDADGDRTTIATLPGFPSGIALDAEGNLYVSNFDFPGVHQIDTNGEISIYAEDDRLTGGVGITFDNDGNLYVGNFTTGAILKIASDQAVERLAIIPTVQQGVVIGYLTFLDDFIYATGIGEHVIYRVSLTGEASIFAGSGTQSSTDGGLLGATFDQPNGIAADPDKNVLYVNEIAGTLRVIDLN
ncbi:MAG: SMP-30/gluconolactonase/LRE family protein [Bacteroidota bacterium]